MKPELIIPEDLFEGTSCLKLGIPWMTPDAIRFLHNNLSEDDSVFEIGGGGSTLFFARRCMGVFALESNDKWYHQLGNAIREHKIENVAYMIETSEEGVCHFIEKAITEDITVISVDPQDFNRSRILNAFLDKGISPKLRMIILDNYANEGIFPLHHDKVVIDSPAWDVLTYDYPRWAGNGTRIYVRK